MLVVSKRLLARFYSEKRLWQGIPSIEKSRKGRLFASFYSGGTKEEYGNFCAVIKSDDDGKSWSEPVLVAYNGKSSRCYDSCLWIDPCGRLWFIWNTMPEFIAYASVCEDPDAEVLKWGKPFPIGNDVMLNKPTVLKDGRWLFPVAVWAENVYVMEGVVSKRKDRLAFAYETRDCGKTFRCLGGADVPERWFDEHMFLQRNDGSISMYVRTKYGIGVCHSADGVKWSEGEDSKLKGPNSRFFIRRLKSGNVLLINHVHFNGRNNLTAQLSLDDGKTFVGGLLLDERCDVSYPDGTQDGEGYIYAIYDRERGCFKKSLEENRRCAKEILFAKFTEKDILAGKIESAGGMLKQIVSKLDNYNGKDLYRN